MDPSSLNKQREAFLSTVHDLTDGYRLNHVDIRQIAPKLGLDDIQSLKIANYLVNEGLLVNVGAGTFGLSHLGIKLLDELGIPDLQSVRTRRNQRRVLLGELNEAEDGTNPYLSIEGLAKKFSWSKVEVDRALDYLLEEGLASAMSGSVEITHKGIKEFESHSLPNSIMSTDIEHTPSCQVFLCHASEDKGIVRQYHQKLLLAGFSPWLDEVNLIPGQEWDLEIRRAVRVSQVIVVFLSKQSVQKRGYYQKEMRQVLDVADEQPEGAIFVIPARLDDCPVPDRLHKFHYVNLFANDGFEKLRRSIETACSTANRPLSSDAGSESDPPTVPDSTSSQRGGVDISGGTVSPARDFVAGDVIHNINVEGIASANIAQQEQLQTYVDRINTLLADGLIASPERSNLRTIARTHTLNTLGFLDHNRQISLLRFLRELSKNNDDSFLFSLEGANLPGLVPNADFSGTYLSGINRSRTDLNGVDFSNADLSGADLTHANLSGARLRGSNLCKAHLVTANLRGAFLGEANLTSASLLYASLNGASLLDANLSGALLLEVDFSGAFPLNTHLNRANFENANFWHATLEGADLRDAWHLQPNQLVDVRSLNDTIMPNGRGWQGSPQGPYTVEELARYFPAETNSEPEGESLALDKLLYCRSKESDARGIYNSRGFTVLKQSRCKLTPVAGAVDVVNKRRDPLLKEGILVQQGSNYVFTQDYTFGAPSPAAVVVLGRNANGWIEWKYQNGKTLKEGPE